MAVTLKQIAELAHVSRGTVDRALHGRGRVNEEVAARIRAIADELGYCPNKMGQALARAGRVLRLGVIVQSCETPLMQIVCQGAQRAAQELRAMGAEVELRFLQSIGPEQLLACMEELKQLEVHGLALVPTNDEQVQNAIKALAEGGIPVVTLNGDAPCSGRLCFVGMDNYHAGQTAATLMGMMTPDGGVVFPLTAHLSNEAHLTRFQGFRDEMQASFPQITLLGLQCCFDRDDFAYEITRHVLRETPDLRGIYVAANGQHGVCRAVREAGLTGRVRVFAYELTEQNREDLLKGDLSLVLDQEAGEQGYRPLMLLYEYLSSGKKPDAEHLYTGIHIKTKFNL